MKKQRKRSTSYIVSTLLAVSVLQVGCAAYQTYKTAPVLEREVDVPLATVVDRVEHGVSVCWNRPGRFLGDSIQIRKYPVGVNGMSLDIMPNSPRIFSGYLTVAAIPVTASLTLIKIREAVTVYSDRYRGFAPIVERWIVGDGGCGVRVPGQ